MEQQSSKRVVLQPRDTRYEREHKAAFALVGITGGLAVLLGFFFLIDHIRSPLDQGYVGPRLLSAAERQQEELEKQAVTDTDNDGLTDFEELYTYRTSPYLSDTDGDTMQDGVEIAAGTDPTCAQGNDCVSTSIGQGGIQDLEDAEIAPTTDVDALVAQIENLGPAEIREVLIATGASETDLALVPDDQLVELYRQTLRELEQSGELEAYVNGDLTEE